MNEVLTPISDTLQQSAWNLRYTTFRLGPMFIHFVLKDIRKLLPRMKEELDHMEDFRTGQPLQFKNYIVFCIVNDAHAYVVGQTDTEEAAFVMFKDYVQRLKFGEEVEIRDEAGMFESIMLSYKGIKWIWE